MTQATRSNAQRKQLFEKVNKDTKKYMHGFDDYWSNCFPLARGACERGFYLNNYGQPGLRWDYADDVARIGHKGWHTSQYNYSGETLRGIVFRLPHERGFIIGYTLGEHMASTVDYSMVHTDLMLAAYAADALAERTADTERDYQREWQRDHDRQSAEDERDAIKSEVRVLLHDYKQTRKRVEVVPRSLCDALRAHIRGQLKELAALNEKIHALQAQS